jgi:hypothetical protein
MIFKMYNCDFGIKYDSVAYDFDHVESIVVEDPTTTKLIRGSNAKNKTGLVYTEGTKEPKKLTVTLIGISQAMYDLFTTIYETKARCECYCIDRVTGSSKIAKQAVLSNQPMQLTVDESPESMNVVVIFNSFDYTEVHKDE